MPIFLNGYRKYKVCQALIYTQQRHMACSKLHICHDLYLDQNANDNAYQTPLLHEALDVNNRMVMFVIGLYQNKFSHLCVENQHYLENDTICVSIFFYWIFSVF